MSQEGVVAQSPTDAPPQETENGRGISKRLATRLEGQGVLIALILVGLFLALFAPAFFSYGNVLNVLRQSSEIGIVAAGMAVVILLGGIDLSVGSTLALSGVAAALFASGAVFDLEVPWVVALAVALLAAAFIGVINGLIVTKAQVSAIIATLAMMTALRGLVLLWTGGVPVYSGIPEAFAFLGRGYVGPVPVPVILLLSTYLVLWIALYRTPFGRYVYAIGGNKEAARLSGIPVTRYTIVGFVICAVCAGLAGVLVLGRLNSAQPVAGEGMELEAISAVALGGISLFGGRGNLSKVLLAAIIIAMLSNGLVLMNVSPYVQMIVIGTVLVAAVAFDVWTERAIRGRK